MPSPVMSSSSPALNEQVVAFLTISGSLALLVLTKGKLALLKKYASRLEQRLREAVSLSVSPRTCQISLSLPPLEPKSSRKPVEAEGAKRVRRVRFSADVVEPKGNSQEYRKRVILSISGERGLTRDHGEDKENRGVSQSHIHSHSCPKEERKGEQKGEEMKGEHKGEGKKGEQVEEERKGEKKEVDRHSYGHRTHLPANWTARYNGLLRSRLQRSLFNPC